MHEHELKPISGNLRDYPEIGVVKCVQCGTVKPEKDTSQLTRPVDQVRSALGAKNQSQIVKNSYDAIRRLNFIRNMTTDLDTHVKVLDWGCGESTLVSDLKGEGIESYGYDPDGSRLSEDQVKAGLLSNDLKFFEGEKFDIITLVHVIEHFHDIQSELAIVRKFLKTGGKLIVETPNAEDSLLSRYDLQEFRKFTFWASHPNLFTQQFLNESLHDAGFSIDQSEQIQRWGLSNHLYWLMHGKPGGHEIWKGHFSSQAESEYANFLISQGVADTLWAVATN